MPWKSECHKEQRLRFIREYLRHRIGLAGLSRRWAISRKTAHKWIKRFKERGKYGLGDRRRVAQRVHNRPGSLWLKRIRRWRAKHPNWGAPKLRWGLQRRFGHPGVPSESSISRWLQRWRLTRKRRRAPHKGPVIERTKLTAAHLPNEVWTVDYKGWFRTGDGTRVEPLTVRDLASRYILAIVLWGRPNVKECRRAFERIFKEYGLPQVIRSDNGSPFGSTGALGLTRLSAWWVKLGIRVGFTDPGQPAQNGAHEQLHRVYQEETAQPAGPTLRAQKRRSQQWRKEYNTQRPHEGLSMGVPADYYRKSKRSFRRKANRPWRYEEGWKSRRVRSKGMISFNGRSRFIGEAFEGERVGLKRIRTGVWEVYYGPMRVGELWDKDGTPGIRAAWYRRRHRS